MGLLEGGYFWNSAPIEKNFTRGGTGCLLERRTLKRNYVVDLLSLLQLLILTYLNGTCFSLFSGMDDVLPNRSPYIPKIMKVTC